MDPDIAKWKRKQMDKNYCGACGGSGQQRVHLTGNPAIDYKTCAPCKGSGEVPSVEMKFGSYDRIGKPWIDFFETERITNERKQTTNHSGI